MAKFQMEWGAPEYEFRAKSVSWYWVSIIIAAAMIAFSVFTKNYLFGFFLVVAEILFIVWGNKEPRPMRFVLSDEEIMIGAKKIHAIKEFEAWSADMIDENWTEIIFYPQARLKMPIRFIAPTGKVEEMRVNLKPFLKEIEHETTLIDSIEKLLRF